MKWILKTLLIALIFIAPQAHATDYYAANVSTGTGSGNSPSNAIGWSTNAIAGLMGGTLTTGNRVFVCGTLTSTSTWNPGGVSGTGIFEVNGDPTLSGCTAGGWDQDFGGSSLVSIGGGGRANIRMTDLFFRDCTTNCIQADGTNIIIASSTFSSVDDSAVLTGTLTANGIYVQGNTFTNWGDATSTAEAGVNIVARDGIAVSNVFVRGNTFTGNGVARYGVSVYPFQTLHTGTVTNAQITGNTFYGDYYNSAINVSNNATGTLIAQNNLTNINSAGGVVIHTGGQGGVGTCDQRTYGTIIRDNIGVHGAIFNSGNTGDASGILVDECSYNTQVLRNETYNNQLAGIYTNDADGTTVIGNVTWGNGINCINMHATSTNSVFYNNSCYHNPTNPAGVSASQGFDGVQVDQTSTGNTFKNNLFIGGPIIQASSSIKGIDADVSITGTNNAIYGFSFPTEGYTETSGITAGSPMLRKTYPTSLTEFRLYPGSPLIGTGVTIPGQPMFDVKGRSYNYKPSIGAWEYGSRDFANYMQF